jgi:hypothetical protein
MITWEHNRPCPYSPVNAYKRVRQTSFKETFLLSYVGYILLVCYMECLVFVFISTGYFRSWYPPLVCLNSFGSSSWIALQIGKKRRRNRTESKTLVIVCTCACVSVCACLRKRPTVAYWMLYSLCEQ